MSDELDPETRESAVNTIAEMWYEYQDDLDAAEMADDGFIRVIQDATEICEAYGIPRGERVDVITDGIRQGLIRHVDENLQDIRFQLEVFSGL